MNKDVDNRNFHLLPWYAHLIGGHALTGIVPWFIVSGQLFQRGRKFSGIALIIVNVSLLGFLCTLGAVSHLTWDSLVVLLVFGNLLWSLGAWLVQRTLFGSAPRRYYLKELKSWVTPVFVALIFGTGLSVVHGLFPIIGERLQMMQSSDLATTHVILWDLFRYTPLYVPYSLLIGIWWAGEHQRFSPSHVISYIGALLLFYFVFYGLGWLFNFLLFKGEYSLNQNMWSVLPRHLDGVKQLFYSIFRKDMTAFAIVPLLIGAVPRMRDFWKRSLAYFPVISVCFIGLSFFSPELWQIYQNQIVYEMSSVDAVQRRHAYETIEMLLDRFPRHEEKAELSLCLADYLYQQGNTTKSREIYKEIEERGKGTRRTLFSPGEIAASVLSGTEPGDELKRANLKMPLISYASYMTSNWMALLRVARFYEKESTPESSMLIRLKELSTDEKTIKLSPMPSLAELDDNAGNLGFNVLILPTDIQAIRALINAGFPVIQPIRQSFVLIHGFEDDRAVAVGSLYRNVPLGLKENTGEDIDTVLTGEADETSTDQSQRVDHLSRLLLPLSFWGSDRQLDLSPLMAVFFPEPAFQKIASVLGRKSDELDRESRAKLAALISLNSMRSGDVFLTIDWAKRSSRLQKSPLPLYSAHLASLLWESRRSKEEEGFPLAKTLPVLNEVESKLRSPEISTYLEQAKEQFNEDVRAGTLPWMIRHEYQDFLDRSNDGEFEILLSIAQQDVKSSPEDRVAWLTLASLHEWREDYEQMLFDLQGALGAGKWDDTLALNISSLMIRIGKMGNAEEMLRMIDPKKIKFYADYYYCKAMTAQWKGKSKRARKNFEKALSMRRYTPYYHLDYAKFLLKNGGDREKATRALQWAERIDARGDVRQTASSLLAKMQSETKL